MDWLELRWKVLVARGAIGIVFGVLAMVWPLTTAAALVLLFGIWALMDGVGALTAAFRVPGGVNKAVYAAIGIVSLVAAFFAIFRPVDTAVALTWILGIWLIARGLMEMVQTFTGATEGPRWIRLAGAALSVVAGAIFAANPGGAALGIAFWLGLIALLWGVALVVAGLMARGMTVEQPVRAEPAG